METHLFVTIPLTVYSISLQFSPFLAGSNRIFLRKTHTVLFAWHQSHHNGDGLLGCRGADGLDTSPDFLSMVPIIPNPVPKMHSQVMWAAGAGGLGTKLRIYQGTVQPSPQCFNVQHYVVYLLKKLGHQTWKYIRNAHRQKPFFMWKAKHFKH